MYGLIAQICALFIIGILNGVYFYKKRIRTTETDLYTILLVTIFVGTIVDIFATSISLMGFPYEVIVYFNKLYFYFLCIVGVLMFYYAYYFARGMTPKEKKQLTKFTFIISIFISFYFLILPLDVYVEGTMINITGAIKIFTNLFLAFWSFVITLLVIYRLVQKNSTLKIEKSIPIFLFVILLVVAGGLQIMNPTLSVITFALVIDMLLMFFTIENPDIRLIEELNIAKNQALRASKAKTDFLSSMSHEIRTPLNAIVGFSQLLKEEKNPDLAKEELDDILMSSNTLLDIINGILDLSKIEANKLEIINKEYEFKKIYNEAIKLAKTKIGEKNIDFICTYDEEIPNVLFGDDIRIKQIILNLLTNAIKYTEKGFVKITVSKKIKNNNCTLTIKVEDSGQGIKKDDLNHLFTKFQRLNESVNTSIEGTGLGLVITKKIIELMNGSIDVKSTFKKGSTFTVEFNQKIIDKTKLDNTMVVRKKLSLPDKKILIVDDNIINLKVASKLIEVYDCQIKTVNSGFECLEEYKNGYDIIFLDDMMPNMTGTETLAKLKENDDFNIPVIALTANALAEMKEKYLNSGFDDYLAKPIDRDELYRVITKYLK